MVWTEIGDIVQRAPAQTMGRPLNTMIVLQEASGGVCVCVWAVAGRCAAAAAEGRVMSARADNGVSVIQRIASFTHYAVALR